MGITCIVLATFVPLLQEGAIPEGKRAGLLGIRFIETGEGLRLEEVLAGTPAESAGLKAGDVISDIAGRGKSRAKGPLDTTRFVQTLWMSEKVTLQLRRGKEELEIETSLKALDRVLEVGGVAPDFTLKSPDGKSDVALSKLTGKKPVVLVFGSYT